MQKLIIKKPVMKFKEGDKVKIVKREFGHNFEIGEIVTIKSVDPEAHGGLGDYKVSSSEDYWWVADEELQALD